MSNDPKQTLQYIISTYGMEVIDDQRRVKGLLMDLCGNYPREVKLLFLSLSEGAVHKLLSYKTLPIEAAIKLSAKILEDSVGMSNEAALWAMETWVVACRPLEIPHGFTNTLQMKFVLIPAGTFMMGSPEDEQGRYDHETLQQVTISKPFYLQTTPVTQGQWQEVMGNNPSRFKGVDNLPVEQVSWNDVQNFIGRLNHQERTVKYRLPSEAEWEYACRAGSTTAYCYGDDLGRLGEYAWYKENSEGMTHPVGQKKPNAWGLYDMHGNVWEWCQDRYEGEKVYGEISSGEDHVVRGGSWHGTPQNVRTATRSWDDQANRYYFSYGFRLFKTAAASDSASKDANADVSDAIEIGRDGRFIAYDNGTVLDTRTNRMWAAKDNGADINWANAKAYCENCSGGGYTDWRMPMQDELAELYDATKSRPAACNKSFPIHVATQLIDITCFGLWTSETRGSESALFIFGDGQRYWTPQFVSSTRALPVRYGL